MTRNGTLEFLRAMSSARRCVRFVVGARITADGVCLPSLRRSGCWVLAFGVAAGAGAGAEAGAGSGAGAEAGTLFRLTARFSCDAAIALPSLLLLTALSGLVGVVGGAFELFFDDTYTYGILTAVLLLSLGEFVGRFATLHDFCAEILRMIVFGCMAIGDSIASVGSDGMRILVPRDLLLPDDFDNDESSLLTKPAWTLRARTGVLLFSPSLLLWFISGVETSHVGLRMGVAFLAFVGVIREFSRCIDLLLSLACVLGCFI
mmetsp:Transcript_26604/g.74440  ORF Transcript_26604/g.74440 Transcript_26604/m.74440 type:complete len:261 (-) Transcript_26604:247-1029(-)